MNYTASEPTTVYELQVRPNSRQSTPPLDLTSNDITSLRVSKGAFMNAPITELKLTPYGITSGTELPVALGQTMSGEIEFSMLKSSGTVYIGNIVRVLVGEKDSNVRHCFQKYRIDKVETTEADETVSVHGYDMMTYTDGSMLLIYFEYPSLTTTDIDVLTGICRHYGYTMDSSVTEKINKGYNCDRVTAYQVRDVLGWIAASYGGAFCIVDDTLIFVDLLVPVETNLLIDEVGDYITFGGDRIIVQDR